MSDDNDFLNDFYAFNSVNGDDNGHTSSGGRGCGSGWIVIAILVILLIVFLSNVASVGAIETLLGFGLIAFIIVRFLFK